MRNKIYGALFLLCLLISCGSPKWVEIGNDSLMRDEYDTVFNRSQLDSICAADTMTNNLNNWLTIPIKDKESGKIINRYMYIKTKDELEKIYIVTKIDSNTFKINKRITE